MIGVFPLLSCSLSGLAQYTSNVAAVCVPYSPLASRPRASSAPNDIIGDLPGYGWVPCAAERVVGGVEGIGLVKVRLRGDVEPM